MKKILSLMIAFFLLFWITNAANINSLNSTDNKTITVVASPEVIFSNWKVFGEIKVLRDIKVSFSSRDFENHKKAVLSLSSDLYANESYSIISVIWLDWTIEFETWDFLWWEIKNDLFSPWERTIEKINITDSRTIEIYYNYDLEDQDFEFKILSELKIVDSISNWDNVLDINLANSLDETTDYIVMLSNLEDIDWNTINFNEALFDLKTPSVLEEKWSQWEQEQEEEKVKLKDEIEDDWNIDDIALNSAETPETWAETNVLIFLTLIASTFYFLRNKFSKEIK